MSLKDSVVPQDRKLAPRKIVLATWGSAGDLFPYLALANRLRQRGHEVIVATSARHEKTVCASGATFHCTRPNQQPDDVDAKAWWAQAMDARIGTRHVLETLILPNIRHTYDDLREAFDGADLFISHQTVMAAPLVAQKSGIPWISTVVSPIIFNSQIEPPVPPIGADLAAHPRFGPAISRALMREIRKRFVPCFTGLEQFRSELGLPPGQHPLFEGQHSPQRVLALFSPLLAQSQPDWPPQTRQTGFCLMPNQHTSLAPELEEFLGHGEPPVLFTLGASSVHDARDFFAQSAAAITQLGKRAIFTASPELVPPNLPPQFFVTPFAPLGVVLPRCAAIVHHGGIGTIAQALYTGTPMLMMPQGHDQPDNAVRAARLGSGRIIWRKHYRSSRVARELSELLTDPVYAQRAAAVRAKLQQEDGVAAACQEIETFMQAKKPLA